jgi:hypothetical protein
MSVKKATKDQGFKGISLKNTTPKRKDLNSLGSDINLFLPLLHFYFFDAFL